MSSVECKTEEQIKQFAKELFFAKGNLSASTQEIADFAGVNRTLVNYYFRSKQHLFEIVYWETVRDMRSEFASIYISKQTFRDKIGALIDYLVEFRTSYPFVEVFNIHETIKLTNHMDSIVNPEYITELSFFLDEIKSEMDKGLVIKGDPMNFLLHIFSLVSYPIIMRPVFERILDITPIDYQDLLAKRKEEIFQILFINNELK